MRVRVGTVNTLIPSQIDEELTLAPEVTRFVYVNCMFNEGGRLQSAAIAMAETVPLPPEGSADNAPGSLSIGLAQVLSSADGIKDIRPLRKASLWVTPVVYNVGCGTVTMIYQVT